MLFLLLLINFIFIIGIIFYPAQSRSSLFSLALFFSTILLGLSALLFIFFDTKVGTFQYVWIFSSNLLNLDYAVGVDGVSLAFIFLSVFLNFICVLIIGLNQKEDYDFKSFKQKILLLFILLFFLINVFSILNLIYFYFFFEATLVPVALLLGRWGSAARKKATYYFIFFTLVGSFLMLYGILEFYSMGGTWNLLSYDQLPIEASRQFFYFWLFFIALAVKLPVVPFHIWLPKAHVEAPTIGSVLLAGILLKLGAYGIYRFILVYLPIGAEKAWPLIVVLAFLSIIYAGITAARQTDLKRIIAYSSVVHMSFALIGLFSGSILGVSGAIALLVSHGIVSGGLFACVGFIYDRFETREIYYLSRLASVMPLMAATFFYLVFANMSFPGTAGFVGEITVIVGIFEKDPLVAIIVASGTLFTAVYSIWLFNRVFFGNKRIQPFKLVSLQDFKVSNLKITYDLNRREAFIMLMLVYVSTMMGVFSSVFFELIYSSVIENFNRAEALNDLNSFNK